MKENVYLVDLGTGSNRNLMPLGIGLISAYAESRPVLAERFNFGLHFLRGDFAEIAGSFERPRVIGFACYVWNLRASLRLAAACKAAHPQATIVVGGYSVPKRPERIEAFFRDNPGVDVLVHGEGEFTFAGLLEAIAAGADLSGVAGITYRKPEGFVTTARRERIADLDAIPSPFLNGSFDRLMAKYGSQVTGVVWETNRGCPFACTFCDWGNADVNKVKQFALSRLEAEIEWIARNKIFYIYLADANFGIFYDRDLHLAGKLAEAGAKHGFPRFMAINWTKNSHERILDIADRLKAGGITTSVTLAMQSFNSGTLDAIKRRNIKQESLLKLKKAYHDRDLPTYTELILGLPGETYASFLDGLNRASTTRLADHWVFHICTLLANTEMDSPEYRATHGIDSRWVQAAIARRGYTGEEEVPEIEELVVGTRSMPVPEWRKAYMSGYMAAALFNFRAAVFPLLWLQQELGVPYTDVVEWLVSEVEAKPAEYPRIARAVGHVRRQQQMLLDSVACLSPVEELGGNLALPHEAALAILLGDAEAFYGELEKAVLAFAEAHDFQPSRALVGDIIRYQKARMPVWPLPSETSHRFAHDVPRYFADLTEGREVREVERRPADMTVQVTATPAKDAGAFAAMRTRSGHTIDLYKVSVPAEGKGAAPRAAAE
ncbi:MAG: B12-binding domain-containing radical SAM protein [Alphaproteobacteria bacterium]|nr:B12-binding domain-containing radical SAM protein [Alphaproteobacteria bacterium]